MTIRSIDSFFAEEPEGTQNQNQNTNLPDSLGSFFAEEPAVPLPQGPADTGQEIFADAVQRGFYQSTANVANLFNKEELTQELRGKAETFRRRVPSFKNVLEAFEQDTLSDSLQQGILSADTYIIESLGELIPELGVTIGAGAVGTIAGGPAAGFGAAVAAGAPFIAGESKQAVQAEGLEGTLDEYIVQSTAKIALDAIPVSRVMSKFGLSDVLNKKIDDALDSEVFEIGVLNNRVTKEGVVLGVQEATTETAQTAIDIVGTNVLTDKDVLSLSPEQKWELIDSFIVGGMSGSAIGAVVGGVTKDDKVQNNPETEQTENNIEVAGKKQMADTTVMLNRQKDIPDVPLNGTSIEVESLFSETNPVNVAIKEDTIDNSELKNGAVENRVNSIGLTEDVSATTQTNAVASVQSWVDAVLPDKKVNILGVQKTMDSFGYPADMVTTQMGIERNSSNGSNIYVNTPMIKQRLKTYDENSALFKAEFNKRLSHQVGQTVISEMFKVAPPQQQQEILEAYRNWSARVETLSENDFLKTFYPAKTIRQNKTPEGRNQLLESVDSSTSYFYTFAEFAAQQMEGSLSKRQGTGLTQDSSNVFWKDVTRNLKKIHSSMVQQKQTDLSFPQWIKSFRIKEDLQKLPPVEANTTKAAESATADAKKSYKEDRGPTPSALQTEKELYQNDVPWEGNKAPSDVPVYSESDSSVKSIYGSAFRLTTNPNKLKGNRIRPGTITSINKMLDADGTLPEIADVLSVVNQVKPSLGQTLNQKFLEDGADTKVSDLFADLSSDDVAVVRGILNNNFFYDGVYQNSSTGVQAFIWTPDAINMDQMITQSGVVPESPVETAMLEMGSPDDVLRRYNTTEKVTMRWYRLMENPATAKILTFVMNPRQVAQRFQESPIKNAIPPLRDYVSAVRNWSNEKQVLITQSDEVIQEWKSLGTDDADGLSRFVFAMTTRSTEIERPLTIQEKFELYEEVNKRPMTEEQYAVLTQIQESFKRSLDGMELAVISQTLRGSGFNRLLANDLIRDYASSLDDVSLSMKTRIDRLIANIESQDQFASESLISNLRDIETSFSIIRDRDYFPMSRFGRYVVNIKVETPEGAFVIDPDAPLTGFYTFDTRREQKQFIKDQEKKLPKNHRIDASLILDDLSSQLVGMPAAFIDRVIGTMEQAGLTITPEQQAAIDELKVEVGPGSAMMKHLNKRGGIKGYSDDAMRTFAAYQISSANNIARVTQGEQMFAHIQQLKSDMATLNREFGQDVVALGRIVDYLQRHFKFLHDPSYDAARLRQFGFLLYLGFNVKSAAVNISQTPMITYPVFTGRAISSGISPFKADAVVSKALLRAGRRAVFIKGKPGQKVDKFTEEENQIYSMMTERGVINQTFARDLAQTADPLAPTWFGANRKVTETYDKIVDMSSVFFNVAEVYNRRVAMLASMDIRQQTEEWANLDIETKAQRVEDDILASQYDFSRENRAELMRGPIKSNIFLFQNYLQNTLNIYTGGEGGHAQARALGVMFAIGGLMGLPGAEDLEYVIDFIYKKYYGPDNYQRFRDDIRSVSDALFDNPEVLTYGLSGRENGLLNVLDSFGVPTPELDLTGSLSMGHIIPGFRGMYMPNDSSEEAVGKMAIAAGGPLAGWAYNVYRSITDDNATTYHRVMGVMPAFVKQAMSAYHLKENQGFTSRKGDLLDKVAPDDFDSRFQYYETLIAASVGFQPTIKTRKFEQAMAERDLVSFYTMRRTRLMDDMYRAFVVSGSREDKARAEKAVRAYNKQVMSNEYTKVFAINRAGLKTSIKQKAEKQALRDIGAPDNPKYIPIRNYLDALYPEDL